MNDDLFGDPDDNPEFAHDALLEDPENTRVRPRATRTGPKARPLSDALRAAVEALGPNLSGILGPEMYEQATREFLRSGAARSEAARTGSLFVDIDGLMRFLYRDREARAWHVFQDLNGMCWPSTKSDMQKRQLREGFKEGWASGELDFLADLTSEELAHYRQLPSDEQKNESRTCTG